MFSGCCEMASIFSMTRLAICLLSLVKLFSNDESGRMLYAIARFELLPIPEFSYVVLFFCFAGPQQKQFVMA